MFNDALERWERHKAANPREHKAATALPFSATHPPAPMARPMAGPSSSKFRLALRAWLMASRYGLGSVPGLQGSAAHPTS